jgi:hypothetical protein
MAPSPEAPAARNVKRADSTIQSVKSRCVSNFFLARSEIAAEPPNNPSRRSQLYSSLVKTAQLAIFG